MPRRPVNDKLEHPDMPFEHTLGITVTRRHKDGVTCRLDLQPGFFNSNGIVHGGITASVADEVAWFAILHALAVKERNMTTTELKVNYLRPIAGRRLTARGFVLKLGRLLCVTRIDIFDEQKRLAAHATVTYMLL